MHADVFARFLRDRIGADNVIFVSGTDCYGSPIVEHHRRLVEAGEFKGDIQEFVRYNHERQKEVLDEYGISLNLYAASSFSKSNRFHEEVCADFMRSLYNNGHLVKDSKPQFYDPEHEVFLNGRQVEGRCPVQGCSSEKAYADECSLGHQIAPTDLIAPKSTLSGTTPVLKEAANWYIDLEKFSDKLSRWVDQVEARPGHRNFVSASLREFLEAPSVYVQDKFMDDVSAITDDVPEYTIEQSKSKSKRLVFNSLSEREAFCGILQKHNIRFRTGKTLVPFRLTGNLDWGLPTPDIEGFEGLTWWVWPESLIAPVSFTAAYLDSCGKTADEWKQWWMSKDSAIYQFIGEDNLYFYGLAEVAMFLGTQGKDTEADPPEGEYQLPDLIVNNHILFLDKKASSTGKVKPPMARDLTQHYTPEQLRAHFFSLGLGLRSVGFKPKPFNPKANERDGDPVLKEGNLLCNVFNRAARSCFYTMQEYFEGRMPDIDVSLEVRRDAKKTILDFEKCMYEHEFHQAMACCDRYIREINKFWSRGMKEIKDGNESIRGQVLADTMHMVRVSSALMHPIAPFGTQMIADYLGVGDLLFDWNHIFDTLPDLIACIENHSFKVLEPRVDFFEKHPSQYK